MFLFVSVPPDENERGHRLRNSPSVRFFPKMRAVASFLYGKGSDYPPKRQTAFYGLKGGKEKAVAPLETTAGRRAWAPKMLALYFYIKLTLDPSCCLVQGHISPRL